MLYCRGTWQEEEAGLAVTHTTFLQTEDAPGTNPAKCSVHQETAHIRRSPFPQPVKSRQTLQAIAWS